MPRTPFLPALALACAPALGACALVSPGPGPAQRYAALPDTVVCVVDRTAERGLKNLQAKRAQDGRVVLLVGREIVPLEEVHPVRLAAGYAGREAWYRTGQPVVLQDRRFLKVEGERRISLDLLRQTGDYRAIPLYVDPSDPPPPEVVYLPTRPGCIFQAYVREDLLARR